MEKRKAGPPGGKRWWIAAAVVLMFAALAAGILLADSTFTLELTLEGRPELVLEYGEPYLEPGVRTTVKGDFILRSGWQPDVQITAEGAVNPEKLGEQTITYRAKYRGLEASAVRKVRIVDTKSPVITLHTDPDYVWEPGQFYAEEGYTAWDNRDGDITHRVVRQEHFGHVTYTVLDSSGNPAYAQREIPEYDLLPPELILEGEPEITIYAGTRFEDPGCGATDNVDGDVSHLIKAEGEVIWYKKGSYTLSYTVSDSAGNETTRERIVHVQARPRTQTVSPGSKVIYLTFDDGPGPYTMGLLDLLESYDVKATFFVVDNGYYDVMRQITDRGHSIGIHTLTHNYRLIYSSEEAFFDDLYGMQNLIEAQTGVKTWLMRFPGGSSNAVSRFNEGIMTRLTEAVEDAGFCYFDWNVDSDDAGNARKPETVYANVTSGAAQNRVSVVLQHDIHRYSVDAVEKILIWGFENGYTFLPLEADSPPMHHGLNN